MARSSWRGLLLQNHGSACGHCLAAEEREQQVCPWRPNGGRGRHGGLFNGRGRALAITARFSHHISFLRQLRPGAAALDHAGPASKWSRPYLLYTFITSE